MDTTQLQRPRGKIDLGLSLAAPAWAGFCRRTGTAGNTPRAVTKLKSQRLVGKSGVYLLEGAAGDGSDVVAKRCRRTTARVERAVYEHVLPHVSVSKLQYHGYADDADGDFCWLFLSDAGRAKLLESESSLAAAWLARLHGEAARLVDQVALPERGPDHYQHHLTTARALVAELRADDSRRRAVEDVEMLQRLAHLLDQLDAVWETICTRCASAPRTLVHGDFGKKNLRVRATTRGPELVALDWETAGWGPIAADLPQMHCRAARTSRPGKAVTWRGTVDLDVYAAHASGAWDGHDRRQLAQFAAVGTIFRYVSSIRWAADQVRGGGQEKPMARLSLYAEELPQAIAAAGC